MKKCITQEDEFGCGVACIAYITGRTYKEVSVLMGPNKAKHNGYFCRDLVATLNSFGCHYGYKYINTADRKQAFLKGSVVFIKRSSVYPSGHYLAYDDIGWMDPWINFSKGQPVDNAKSGFRKRLPGEPIYSIYAL
jgi:hypothetical protein